MRVGIDASNVGGGGGITHLKELLEHIDNVSKFYGIEEIIIFSSEKILEELPVSKILKKVTFDELNKSIFTRLRFQVSGFDEEITKRCDILFSVTGDYIGKFKPMVGMSRNMLLYEREIWREIKQPKEILRFWLNFKKQERCFKNAEGIIFISTFAQEYANKALPIAEKKQIKIPHGLSHRFTGIVKIQKHISEYTLENPFNFLYVSTVHVYKNQWRVVKAIGNLRKKGYPVTLTLIGSVIFKPAGDLLEKTIEEVDLSGEFIKNIGHVSYNNIEQYYKDAAGIIFASNCENMPNILMESMASGVPIICSNKEPMPEFLKNGGHYFDPKSIDSLESAILEFLSQPEKRQKMAERNLQEVKNYTWKKTADETFKFIYQIYNRKPYVKK